MIFLIFKTSTLNIVQKKCSIYTLDLEIFLLDYLNINTIELLKKNIGYFTYFQHSVNVIFSYKYSMTGAKLDVLKTCDVVQFEIRIDILMTMPSTQDTAYNAIARTNILCVCILIHTYIQFALYIGGNKSEFQCL